MAHGSPEAVDGRGTSPDDQGTQGHAQRQRTRRRLLRAGLLGVPAIITIRSRPAYAAKSLQSSSLYGSQSP